MKDKELIELVTRIEPETTKLDILKNNTQVSTSKYYNEVFVLDDIPVYDIIDYDISNDKEFVKYVEDIKRISTFCELS